MRPIINQRLRDLQPGAMAELAHANAAAREAADPVLLELCRCVVVLMLNEGAGSRAVRAAVPDLDPQQLAALENWESADVFSPLERAALGFTQQFVLSVSAMSTEQVEALRTHLDDAAVYAFAAAIYLIEMTERLEMVSRVVIGEEAPV
jgi:alkylhydroperoxidase family enzyme